jgi:hypothetical protein
VTRPVSPYFFDLQPGYSYPFPAESTLGGGLGPTLLRGALLRADGEGIANATLRVRNGSNAYRTDSTGKWVLVFPDTQVTENVTLSVSLTDPVREIQVENIPVIRGRETGLPLTALEGRVLTRAGAGISGAVIEIGAPPSKSKARGDGSWFYYFPLDQPASVVAVTARLPDGRSLTHSEIAVQPRITTPVPVFQFS